MTRFRLAIAAVSVGSGAALAIGALAATAGLSAQAVAFKATYSGKATTKATGNRVAIAAHGTGSGTLVGKSKIAGNGKGDSSNPPCVPFTGPGSITAGNGARLKFTVQSGSTGCAATDDQNSVTVRARAKFNGGTGKFSKAHGSVKFNGHYDRGTGAFTVKFRGTLTLG